MMRNKMVYVAIAVASLVFFAGWKLTSRTAYESAQYSVLETDGNLEIREYPDLTMASTPMQFLARGNDGSFGRLFNYISGRNETEQKIAMTTPVFMERESEDSTGQMSFVLPRKFDQETAPRPSNTNVNLTQRSGGRFAVIRFAGRINSQSIAAQKSELKDWMARQGYQASLSLAPALSDFVL